MPGMKILDRREIANQLTSTVSGESQFGNPYTPPRLRSQHHPLCPPVPDPEWEAAFFERLNNRQLSN